jgi:two-component sensor histidine kinase
VKNNKKKWFSALLRNALLQHLAFWVLAYYILLNLFAGSDTKQTIDYIYTGIFLCTLFIPVAINLFLLIPKLLNNGRFIAYCILILSSLFVFSFFNQLLFDRLIDLLLPGYYFISYYSYGDLLKFFAVFLVITTLLKLSKEWFELSKARQKITLLEKEKLDAELKALMNQVNPHFLFNSLNVLYSLAMKKKPETPDAIIRLSDILRYVIYESGKETVTLNSEIELLNNYLQLQQYRVDASSKIEFVQDVTNGEIRIAPMLLLPLLENSFKHGVMGDTGDTFIRLKLSQQMNRINFTIVNNKGTSDEQSEQKAGGVGLENIRNRLKLMYPENHTFDVTDNDLTFKVELTINTPV